MSRNQDNSSRPVNETRGISGLMQNVTFIALLVGGIGFLTAFLMGADRVDRPSSFKPKSKRHLSVIDVAAKVDSAFQSDWEELGITQVADRADNLTIARRLALGLAGTLPSLQEIREIEKIAPEEQINWWASRLLEDRRTSNHVAERLTRALVGVDDGPFVVFRRRRFSKWLSDQLHSNRKYDRIVDDLLTDEGLWTDTPSVNFFTANIMEGSDRPDAIHMAGRTSRAFLGMRIDCLQCHDDFLGTINLVAADDPESGLQTDFHSLAAFFAETNVSLLGVRDNKSSGPYNYKLLDEEEESLIEPQFPFLRELDSKNENLRVRLADWVTHPENRPFSRAIVNRMWAVVCGQPLVEPVDDIPIDGPFPGALEVLVDDFVEHKFDLHRLVRIISQTRAFQTASTADFEITPQLENNWAVFPMVRLRPDQVAGSIVQSTSFTTIDSTAHIVLQLTKFGQENEFVERYGDPGEDEFVERGETVTQRLLMLNGNMIRERLRNGLNSVVSLGGLSPSAEKSIETIYLATLCRRPTEKEQQHFIGQLEGLQGNERGRKIHDIYWTLINSVEFAWGH